MTTVYGDISPRTAGYAVARLLERALPNMCLSRFGQMQPVPKNKSTNVTWRRYNGFKPSLVPLVEGVTPAPNFITKTDVSAVLRQYGERAQLSDVILDTHEDPVLMENADIMGEAAAQLAEIVIYNAIKAGTNVLYSGSSAGTRASINSAITAAVLDRAIRQLSRQNAKRVTKALKGTDAVGTMPIRPSYIGVIHPDMKLALETVLGTAFKDAVEYANGTPMLPNEEGAYKNIRFFSSTLFEPFYQAATTTGAGTTYMTGGQGGGASGVPDVYPIIIFGENAFANVALAGENAVHPIVLNPKPSDSDPLGQRAHVAFKTWLASAILNDAYMVRVETLVAQ